MSIQIPQFRPRNAKGGESLGDYLKSKQAYELAHGGETTIHFAGDENKKFRYQPSQYETESKKYYENLDITPPTEIEQQNIRDQMRKQVQAQIDAINQAYKELLQQERQQGQERLGQTRALAARSGTLMSDTGQAHLAKTQQFNASQQKMLEAEKAAKVASILENADRRAEQKIEAERQRAMGNYEKYLNYLKDTVETARKDVATLADAGISLDRLKQNKDYYKQFLEETGMPENIFDLYYEANMPETNPVKSWKVNAVGDSLVVSYPDPLNPQQIKTQVVSSSDLGVPVKKDYEYKISTDNNGNVWLDYWNKDNPTEKGSELFGKHGVSKKANKEEEKSVGGWEGLSSTEKSKIRQYIAENGTIDDLKRAMNDQNFLFWILKKAIGD